MSSDIYVPPGLPLHEQLLYLEGGPEGAAAAATEERRKRASVHAASEPSMHPLAQPSTHSSAQPSAQPVSAAGSVAPPPPPGYSPTRRSVHMVPESTGWQCSCEYIGDNIYNCTCNKGRVMKKTVVTIQDESHDERESHEEPVSAAIDAHRLGQQPVEQQ